jgi:hypothetical protein
MYLSLSVQHLLTSVIKSRKKGKLPCPLILITFYVKLKLIGSLGLQLLRRFCLGSQQRYQVMKLDCLAQHNRNES